MNGNTIDEITVNYEEDGILLVKELDKEILSKGLNTTILFRYCEWNNDKQDYGPEKYGIRRYKKVGGVFRQQSKFTISSARQAKILVAALQKWVGEEEASAEAE